MPPPPPSVPATLEKLTCAVGVKAPLVEAAPQEVQHQVHVVAAVQAPHVATVVAAGPQEAVGYGAALAAVRNAADLRADRSTRGWGWEEGSTAQQRRVYSQLQRGWGGKVPAQAGVAQGWRKQGCWWQWGRQGTMAGRGDGSPRPRTNTVPAPPPAPCSNRSCGRKVRIFCVIQ